MNKADIVEVVANEVDLPKAQAGRALDAILDAVTKALKDGGQVAIAGFGTFEVRHRAARKGRNPQTGAEINIAAANTVGFKVAKALKEAVN